MSSRELLLKYLEPCVDKAGGRQEAYYKGLAENYPTASFRVCVVENRRESRGEETE